MGGLAVSDRETESHNVASSARQHLEEIEFAVFSGIRHILHTC